MQKSNMITKYILIKAYTNSEWDSCEFAIIHVTDEWKNTMQERLKAIEPFIENHTFYNHSYWDAPKEFYKTPDEENEFYSTINEILSAHETWSYITLDENELPNFPKPKNSLHAYILIITKYGTARFKARGEYTDEEFYTEVFDIAELIKKQ